MSLAELERPPVARRTTTPFISVITPVRNEAAHIRATLVQLLTQHYPVDRFEILVADGESTDATREIVKGLMLDHANLRLLENARRWSSGGRNAALRESRGDIILLIDGHCELPSANHLAEVAQAFERSGADCLGRPQPLDLIRATPLQRAIAVARASRLGHHPASFIHAGTEGFVPPQSVAVAYRRTVFERIGCFDERFDACEDYEFNTRVAQAGLTCFFTPRVAVRYHPRDSLNGLFRQMVRYGRGRVRLVRKHRASFSPAVFVPALFLLAVFLGPLLALPWPALWLVYGGMLGVYAATLGLFALILGARQRSARMMALLPGVFATVHAGAGWGVLVEALRSEPSPLAA